MYGLISILKGLPSWKNIALAKTKGWLWIDFFDEKKVKIRIGSEYLKYQRSMCF